MTKRYYATGNFSKFIPSGAVRVQIGSDDPALKLLAFKKDGKTTVIAINDAEREKPLTLPVPPGTAVTVAITDDTHDLDQSETQTAAFTLSARSVTTFVF